MAISRIGPLPDAESFGQEGVPWETSGQASDPALSAETRSVHDVFVCLVD